jgi:hypothetical protein
MPYYDPAAPRVRENRYLAWFIQSYLARIMRACIRYSPS